MTVFGEKKDTPYIILAFFSIKELSSGSEASDLGSTILYCLMGKI
jgi:hypothetical protein